MLPPLLKKAPGDAGFDLLLGSHAEWERIGVSGGGRRLGWCRLALGLRSLAVHQDWAL